VQRTLLLLLIAASYTLFAGSPRWTLGPLGLLAAAAVLVAPRRTLAFPRHLRALDWSLLALTAALAVQIMPLPRSVVSILSPHAGELQRGVMLRPADTGSWAQLSIDPAATEVALATLVLGIITFWIARGIFSFGGSTRQFCRALAIIGAAAGVSAIIFRATAPGLVHGMLAPETQGANPFGAFVNRNHFAGWLLLAAGPVGGYLIAHLRIHPAYRQRFRRGLKQFLASGALVTAVAAAIIVGVLLLTLSRSGATGLGCAVLFAWRVGRHRLKVERTNIPLVLALIGAALLVTVLFVDIAGWRTRIGESFDSSSDRSRITIWRETVPLIRDFWLTGPGAGTYSDAMIRYQTTRAWVGSMGRWAHFNNAHSHYVQTLAEGGVLLSLPAGAALFLVARLGRQAVRNDRGEMQWARIGAAGALIGMAVQSLWETSLIMPANAILCGAVLGLLLYHRGHSGNV
jgi:putative inorganic carbon (hco3(-)) transporter